MLDGETGRGERESQSAKAENPRPLSLGGRGGKREAAQNSSREEEKDDDVRST